MFDTKYLAAVALALAHWPSAIADLVPYSDAGCTQPVTITDTNGVTWSSVTTGGGVTDFDDPATWIFGASYSVATASDSSNVDLWWSIENVGDGCRNALLIDYSQGEYGSMGQTVAPGNVVLNGDSGCIYSSVPANRDIGGAFCCGSGDCSILGLGNDALLNKRDGEPLLGAREPMIEDLKTRIATEKMAYRNQAAAQREKRDDSDDWAGTCTAVNVDGPFPQAAPQTIVANTQTCTGSPCDFAIAQAISSQYTQTSTTTQTITNGFGAEVTLKTGIDFIVDFDVSASASYEFSSAVSHATSTSLTTANTTTVTNTLGQYTGTTAFATFTGTFTCYNYQLDCGTGSLSDPIVYCTPSFIGEGSGETLQGDYNVVYLA